LATWLSALNRNWDFDDNRLNVNGNNWNDNDGGHAFGIVRFQDFILMKTYKNLYDEIISVKNLVSAWKKAREGKTKKIYVVDFEKNLGRNLRLLREELQNQTYTPKPLKTFVLRDPKTRKISKSDFRDRVVHHALVRVIEPIFDSTFIYDNSANRKDKGNLFAIERFDSFVQKVSRNGKINGWFTKNQIKGYCLKADIKHYFNEVNHRILLKIMGRKIKDEKVMILIRRIVASASEERERDASAFGVILRGCPLAI